ncbi:protein translocase subunit SecD [Patescibacteria group bacterium]|nr:protein translocase subunit SecD [Patescibacteria group bacterium]
MKTLSNYGAIVIFVLVFICVVLNLPKIEINKSIYNVKFNYVGGYKLKIGNFERDLSLKKGLDIDGGVRLVLKPDLSEIKAENRKEALSSLKNIIEQRINRFGVNEPNVVISLFNNEYNLFVEIPGIKNDFERAVNLIGTTAKLSFRIEKGTPTKDEQTGQEIPNFENTDLISTDITKAEFAMYSSQTGISEPSVKLTFTPEGAKKFSKITSENVLKRLAIYLDDLPIIAPVIQQRIDSGEAYITGSYTTEGARDLAIQINSGALPVPVKIEGTEFIGPSIGEKSIYRSVIAGIFGLFLVAIFMILNYGRFGIFSVISLLIYSLLNLTLYKLIPVTITLPGIAGFILAIGMAVDSNILIFESIKEQKRKGYLGLEAKIKGFDKAWNSIKDANLVTLIISFVLFNPFEWGFLLSSGPVRGFAFTLALGVLSSLFTGVFISRVFILRGRKG